MRDQPNYQIDPSSIVRVGHYRINHRTFKPQRRYQSTDRATIDMVVKTMNDHPDKISFAGDWSGNRQWSVEFDNQVYVAFNS